MAKGWSKERREAHRKTMKASHARRKAARAGAQDGAQAARETRAVLGYESATLDFMLKRLKELPEYVRDGLLTAAEAESYVRRLKQVPVRNK